MHAFVRRSQSSDRRPQVLGILITGMLVPYNDPALLGEATTAAQSPYVIAMTRAGVKVLPHIINACIFTSAFSAGNSFLFSSSRVLYGLALRGQAPRVFAFCTKAGLPIVAVLTCVRVHIRKGGGGLMHCRARSRCSRTSRSARRRARCSTGSSTSVSRAYATDNGINGGQRRWRASSGG